MNVCRVSVANGMLAAGTAGVLAFLCTVSHARDAKILSHPPQRPDPAPANRPMGRGPAYFADAVKGDDANDGTKERPWKTIQHALTRLKAGDTLHLRGGSFYENVVVSLQGTEKAPITIRSFPGEQAVIDGGIPEFFESPEAAWEPFPGGGTGEYRSKDAFPNLFDVVGRFGDSFVGLQTYYHLMDLRATQDNFIQPKGEGKDVEPVYCGPGLHYDPASGHIHARLAHTQLKNPAFQNYRGETDPRKLPLIIAPLRSVPLTVYHARHVRFQDLIIRGGGYDTVKLVAAAHIDMDNCTVRTGTYGLHATGTQALRFYRSALYGNIPPWGFRGENSLRNRPGRGRRDIARLTGHALLVTENGKEFDCYAIWPNSDWEVAYSEFTDCHDGLYIGGITGRFHHNLIDNMQDDGFYLAPMYPWTKAETRIYQNYIKRCLMAFAWGGPDKTLPGSMIYIYRNVVDQTGTFNYSRGAANDPEGKIARGVLMADHGGPTWTDMTIYHNTFFMYGSSRGAGQGLFGHLTPEYPRKVFNNIFLHGSGANVPRAAVLKSEIEFDGNLYWSLDGKAPASAVHLDGIRNSPDWEKTKEPYAPGFAANSLIVDPKLGKAEPALNPDGDYRLQKGSGAIDKGAPLPADWEDPLRSADKGKPDIGAIPLGAPALEVGRDAAPETR